MLLQITNPLPGQTVYIDAMGRMPALRCEARLTDGDNQVVKTAMQWGLQIVENVWPAACPSAKVGRQMMSAQGMSAGLGVWTPAFHTVMGGDATLTVSTEYEGNIYQAVANFRVRGSNPSPGVVLDRLGGEKSPFSRMAVFLSGLKQFDIQGMPYLGSRGEVGIMQLCDPPAQPLHRWSWVQNVDAGKALMQTLEGKAKAYLDQYRVDDCYLNDRSLSDAAVLLRETLQRYLGQAYWRWDEPSQRWCANPPDEALDAWLQG